MEGQASPFIFDGPLPPAEVVGREAELGALLDRAHRGRFTLVYAPRRFGKTSLIHRLTYEADGTRDLAVIFVDLDGVQTIADVARRMQDAYRRLPRTAIGKALPASLAALSRVEIRTPRANVRLRQPDNAVPVVEQLLDFPAEAARKTGVRVLVVLDEFQSIAAIDQADAVLRSKIQHQREHVSYLFSGSEQGLLNVIFADRSRPLYGQAEQLVLGPLPTEAVVEMITSKFADTNRDPGTALEPLVEAAEGHPQRVAFLADSLWHVTRVGEAATTEEWIEARDRALRYSGPEFAAIEQGLSPVQRKLLRLLAYDEPPYGGAARRLDIAKASATAAINTLQKRSILTTDDETPRIIDPLLAIWLRDRHAQP